MGIIIREAELPADREILLTTLLRNRDHGDNALREKRFEWSYSTNPYGRPRSWLALRESSGKIIGAASAFPRSVLIEGKPLICWNGGDTSIDREYRTLGVSMKLRRAVKDCVCRNEITFLYSHPVDQMCVVLEKIGHVVIGKLIRHIVVLRLDCFFEKIMGKHLPISIGAKLGNLFLLAWRGNFCHSRDLTISLQSQNRFDDEYDELFERVGVQYPVITIRDAKFLSWRFLQNPLHKHIRIFRLECDGQLQGYAVVDFYHDTAEIIDFLIDGSVETAKIFLASIINWLRDNRICAIALRTTNHNLILKALRAFGLVFHNTNNSAIAIYASSSGVNQAVLNVSNWFMTRADRDI